MKQQQATRPLTASEQALYDVLAKHYKERLETEHNLNAKRVLRPRLINIKGILFSKRITTASL